MVADVQRYWRCRRHDGVSRKCYHEAYKRARGLQTQQGMARDSSPDGGQSCSTTTDMTSMSQDELHLPHAPNSLQPGAPYFIPDGAPIAAHELSRTQTPHSSVEPHTQTHPDLHRVGRSLSMPNVGHEDGSRGWSPPECFFGTWPTGTTSAAMCPSMYESLRSPCSQETYPI